MQLSELIDQAEELAMPASPQEQLDAITYAIRRLRAAEGVSPGALREVWEDVAQAYALLVPAAEFLDAMAPTLPLTTTREPYEKPADCTCPGPLCRNDRAYGTEA